MADQQSTTHSKSRRPHLKRNLLSVRQVLAEQDEENAYALFAQPHVNYPIVAAAVGAALGAQRESVNLSPDAAASRANMGTPRLRAIEKGAYQPNISTFLSLCEAVGVDPRELFNSVLTYMSYPMGYMPVRNSQPAK